jgi:hypothetical protein
MHSPEFSFLKNFIWKNLIKSVFPLVTPEKRTQKKANLRRFEVVRLSRQKDTLKRKIGRFERKIIRIPFNPF